MTDDFTFGVSLPPERPSDGPALPSRSSASEVPRLEAQAPAPDVWDNLPPHLQEALRGALEGLSEAFEDHTHPFSPALQALWDVTDQIEAYALAQEESFGPRE